MLTRLTVDPDSYLHGLPQDLIKYLIMPYLRYSFLTPINLKLDFTEEYDKHGYIKYDRLLLAVSRSERVTEFLIEFLTHIQDNGPILILVHNPSMLKRLTSLLAETSLPNLTISTAQPESRKETIIPYLLKGHIVINTMPTSHNNILTNYLSNAYFTGTYYQFVYENEICKYQSNHSVKVD